jgi:hypothetical protein
MSCSKALGSGGFSRSSLQMLIPPSHGSGARYVSPPDDAPQQAAYGLLVVFDGFVYHQVVPVPTIYDKRSA